MPQIGRRLPQIWKNNQRISASISVICVLENHFDLALGIGATLAKYKHLC